MDSSKVATFRGIAMSEFLTSCQFGKDLLSCKTCGIQDFRGHCKTFIDRFVVLILEDSVARSGISKGLYSFCPELMIEGDNRLVLSLFAELCRLLEVCGIVSSDLVKAAAEEFGSYVVEQRRYHAGNDDAASGISYVTDCLLRDFGYSRVSNYSESLNCAVY